MSNWHGKLDFNYKGCSWNKTLGKSSIERIAYLNKYIANQILDFNPFHKNIMDTHVLT